MTARIPRSFALSCLLAAAAIAGEIPSTRSTVVDVSSGGVALGNYQGGYLLGRTIKESHGDRHATRILTGASAGAINTLGGIYYAFHPVQSGQTFSPYAQWLGIDWKGLALELEDSSISLLSVDSIEHAMGRVVDSILMPPSPGAEGAQVQFGFAITRFLPEIVNGDLGVQSAAEKIVVRMRWLEHCPDSPPGTGCYQAWTTGYGTASQSDRRAVNQLWFGDHGTDRGLIRQNLILLARASSAFPFAFPPTRIQLYNWINTKADTSRSEIRSTLARHIGAILEHRKKRIPPLVSKGFGSDMAQDTAASRPLARWSARAGLAWARCFEGIKSSADPDTNCIVARSGDSLVALRFDGDTLFFASKIDSAHGRWPKGRPVKFSDGGRFENQPLELAMKILEDSGSVDFASRSASSTVRIRMLSPMHYAMREAPPLIARSMTSEWILALMGAPDATSQELLAALERSNVDDIELNTTSLPLASEHVMHFSGFFEKRFRRFDFLVGLLDALAPSAPAGNLDTSLLDSIGGLPDKSWIRATLGLDPRTRGLEGLFLDARRLSLAMQVARNRGVEFPKDSLGPIATLRGRIRTSIRIMDDYAPGDSTIQQAADVLRVLHASLTRLQGTFEALNNGDDEKSSKRYANFRKGLGECPFHRGVEQRSDINDVYAQATRFVGNDVLGAGNGFLYPMGLYHARTAIGIAVGQKPRWSPGYLRVEGANPGFRILQGYSVLPRSLAPLPILDLMRWEAGLHSSWNSDTAQFWIPVRIGLEIPMCTYASLVPSATWEWSLTKDTSFIRYGIDLLAIDFIHIRLDIPGWEMPEVTAGVRIGFDPVALSEGLFNGTNKSRRLGSKPKGAPSRDAETNREK